MPSSSDTLKPYRLYLGMFLLNLAVVIGVIYLLNRAPARPVVVSVPPTRAAIRISPTPEHITVIVTGAVEKPGEVQLDGNAMLAAALQKAGVQSDADLSKLNLTRALRDGDKIAVPARTSSARATEIPARNATPVSGEPTPARSTKLNLNTASLQELDELPGIGPTLAQRILDYRAQQGSYKSIEELKEVKGIGDTLFDEIKEQITVQ